MYSYIKGILRDMDEESIVVETGGIGYHIYTTGQTFRYLPSVGEEVKGKQWHKDTYSGYLRSLPYAGRA